MNGATPASVLDPATGTQIRIGAPPQRTGAVSQHSRARSAALMMRDAGSFPPAPNRVVAGRPTLSSSPMSRPREDGKQGGRGHRGFPYGLYHGGMIRIA